MSDQITLPGPSYSRSKGQKKGWKTWAKRLSNVRSLARNGFDYDGEFLPVGETVEVDPGDVILHVDDSAGADIRVVVPGASRPLVAWVVSSTGSKWPGALAKAARQLLAMCAEERVRWTARFALESGKVKPENRPHYETLAAVDSDPCGFADEAGPAHLPRLAAIDAIDSIVGQMYSHADRIAAGESISAEVLRELAGSLKAEHAELCRLLTA